MDNGLLKLNITNKFNFIQMKMNVSKFKVFKLNFISEWVFTQLNKTFPRAIFVPQINSLSVSVRGELGLSGCSRESVGRVTQTVSQEWTKMRNYRHERHSISAQIYFTRYIGEDINQFIINFYVQIFQCILHNPYLHTKLKFKEVC